MLTFAITAHRYSGGSTARWLDDEVQGAVEATGLRGNLWNFVVEFGDTSVVVMVALLLSGIALALGNRRIALLAVAGPGLTGASTTLLKPLIGRTLEGDFAYPSGHAGGATALGMIAALLIVDVLRPAAGTSALLLATGTLVPGGTMALALIVDEQHYPTDTVGGLCIAIAVVIICALVIERWAEHPMSTRRSR